LGIYELDMPTGSYWFQVHKNGFAAETRVFTVNNGDAGATTDRPVIGTAVVPRNAGRGRPIYDLSARSLQFSVRAVY
jgi:hypothetical protein